jgi:demethylmenaquinone methyltransferase/2-methoxy-6-polyprenyl-1,4-benzoquinol methylase
MFADIAPRYDLMNRLMTLGQDRKWRKTVVDLCALPPGGELLDVATGTGDIGYEALRRDPTARIAGLDLTREMMLFGRDKYPDLSFPFMEGDALALPYADDSFDAATSGFMMRNVVDIRAAFAEQARYGPGGRAVTRHTPVLGSCSRYFFGVVPRVGRIISGHGGLQPFARIGAVFPRPFALAAIMESAGYGMGYRMAMVGTVAIHWGTR